MPNASAALAEMEKDPALKATFYEMKSHIAALFREGTALASEACREVEEEEDAPEEMRVSGSEELPRMSWQDVTDASQLIHIKFRVEQIFDLMGVPDVSKTFARQIKKERARMLLRPR
jgi:hypothetical protein